MGRESQLARVWALDGARHTALKSPAGAIVSRRVRGVMGSVIGGVVGSGLVLSLWRLSGVGPGGSSPHL